MTGAKRKFNSASGSRGRQKFSKAALSPADLLRNQLKTHTQTQITKLKASQTALKAKPVETIETDDFDFSVHSMAAGFDEGDDIAMENVLEGRDAMDHSNAGDFEVISESFFQTTAGERKRKDYRKRRDRTERRNERFAPQLESMVEAYMAWYVGLGPEGLSVGVPAELSDEHTGQTIAVVDLFRSFYSNVTSQASDLFWFVSLVRQGLWPCSPGIASVAITTRTLEFFRIQSLRCPRLSVQPFVKSLCDVQGVPFKPYLREQFSIAFDLYLDTLRRVDTRVTQALERDTPNWRLANNCPCCTYRVEGEPSLRFSILATMDGNNSLKRIYRKEVISEGVEKSKERLDSRTGGGDYFLPREEVDEWSKLAMREIVADRVSDEEEPNLCAERWKNLNEEVTAKMWGIFEETGIFLSLCRHGMVLLVADMVRSGELAKYPLAIVKRLLDVFGANIGMGYDIGCGFGTTINKSALGPQAQSLGYTSLVGAFHGHAHSRLCQTSHLATYIPGLGLEPLEECEIFFSESNELASSTRHMSVFHRRQAIARYFHHHDNLEAYSRLSKILVDKYKQALEIQSTAPALAMTMNDLNIDSPDVFSQWLIDEREYLKGLKREPPEETLQMEYFRKLVKLTEAQTTITEATREWITYTPETVPLGSTDGTRQIETKRRHAAEKRDDLRNEVQALETKLGIKTRWTPDSTEWTEAKDLVDKAKYRRALDKLEGLVVGRLLELTKMNMSHTGYKMRKHISDSLRARSQAIRTAITNYNAAASEIGRPTLSWDDVVEYSFLSDFDLLRDARKDVRSEPWARPAGRLALDQYYKLVGAETEILQLNKEITSLITYIHEESAYLSIVEARVGRSDPLLAAQIRRHAWERGRSNDLHIMRLKKLERMQGFTGSLVPGKGSLFSRIQGSLYSQHPALVNDHIDDEDGPPAEEDSDDEVELVEELTQVIQISSD